MRLPRSKTPDSSMRNLLRSLFALTLIFGVMLAMGYKPPAPPADYIFMNGVEPETMDPHKATGVPEGRIMIAMFEGLTAHDTRTLKVIPGLAKSWDTSPDGMTYTFHLRDADWSDGLPFTSADVLYSIERILRPETASDNSEKLWDLPNAEDYTSGRLRWSAALSQPVRITDSDPQLSDEDIKAGKKPVRVKLASLDGAELGWAAPDALKGPENGPEYIDKFRRLFGVSTPDEHTVIIHLKHPVPYLLDLLTNRPWWPVPHQAIEKWGNEQWILPEHIVVIGAYTLESWELGQGVTLKKNPKYYNAARVTLNRVTYLPIDNRNTALNIFATSQGNMWSEMFPSSIIEQVKVQPFFHRCPKLAIYEYRLNTTKPPFNNAKVRRALGLAIDRAYITDFVTRGGEIPAEGYVPPGIPGYEGAKLMRYDPEAARKLLVEAGYPGGVGLPPFEILFNRDDTHTKIAESIQNMWKKTLNITVNLHPQEWKVYLGARRTLNYDVVRGGWTGEYVDPDAFLANFVSNSGNNQTGWKNSRYDTLMKEANRMTDSRARFLKLRDAETLLLTEQPVIPIYYYVNYSLYDDTRWVGFYGNLTGEYKPQEIHERRTAPKVNAMAAPAACQRGGGAGLRLIALPHKWLVTGGWWLVGAWLSPYLLSTTVRLVVEKKIAASAAASTSHQPPVTSHSSHLS